MAQLTNRYELKISKEMYENLEKLKQYKICPTKFVRLAIREKLDREHKKLIQKQEKLKLIKIKDKYF